MNGTPLDDRVSAYFDDQLSLDERAQMEQMLASDPAARAELNDYRQISNLLKSLPVSRAPEELLPSVMRGIERDSLLPAKDSPARRFRWKTLVGAAAALALVATAASIFTPKPQQVAQPDPVKNGSFKTSKQLANTNESVQNESEPTQKQFHLNSEDLATAKPGDEIKATSADGVSVIRLTVVDLQRGATALRVLLSGEQIKPVAGSVEEASDGVIAVYVQSDPSKIASTLEKLKQESEYQSISAPVSLESSDPALQGVFSGDLAAAKPDSQQTVAVKPGSELDKLAKSTEASKKPAADSMTAQRRVIFLIVNEPKTPKAEGKPNGAA